jgi:hypothetical protein
LLRHAHDDGITASIRLPGYADCGPEAVMLITPRCATGHRLDE